MGIEDAIEDIIKDDNAASQAVKSLIEVKDRQSGKLGSDIELKTDLDFKQVCVHTAAGMLNNILEMPKTNFNKECILGNLVEMKERKLLSKDRKSRNEIVNVAKQPETIMQDGSSNFVKKMFTPHNQGNK